MKQEVKDLIEEAFDLWLLDEYLDEIHNEEDLIKAEEDGYKADEFIKQIIKEVM